jgi:GLPGLI family protein
MRKLSLFFLIAFCFSTYLSAQKDSAFASVRYAFTHIEDTTWPENPLKTNMILLLGANMSNYTNFDRMERLKNGGGQVMVGNVSINGGASSPMQAPSPEIAASIAVNGNYYKDISNATMSLMAYTNGKLFAVEEKTPAIEWNITQETKEIMGLQCQKATGDFKGRNYSAWFCSQLPYNNGPWKLGGLPGLIIEAYDTKKEVAFNFVSFENASGKQIPIEIPASASKTTVKEYNQYQEALAKDRQAMKGSSGGFITVSGGLMSADGKPARMRQRNNPIEKETKKP